MSETWKYIKRKLDDDSTIRGDKLAFDTPQKQKPPFVSFFLSDMDPVFTKDQESTPDEEFWVLISSDVKVEDAISNADNIRTLFDHVRGGTAENITVQQSMFLGRNIPLVEEDEHGNKIFRVIDTYQFSVI